MPDGRPVHLTEDTPFGLGLEAIMTKAEAVDIINRAAGKTPADWLSYMHLGTALHICGDSKAGLKFARKAVEMHRCATTLLDLAVILETFGQFDEALVLSIEANKLDPTNQFAGLLFAQGQLRQGRWSEAWEDFERYCWGRLWEVGLEEYIPQWQGEDLEGKRILVLQGGGFGDNLMFMRWFHNLKQLGAHITYACPDVMVPLLEGHPWIDRLLPTHEGPETDELPEVDLSVKEFDCFVPIMGLAKRCIATVRYTEIISKRIVPYIKPKHAAPIRKNQKPLVGFCWAGAEKLDPRRHRSLTMGQAREILSCENVDWVNLQFGIPPPAISVWQPVLANWGDTADLIAGLDLVITVDTGVMHLAGAMGKPTWVLLPGLSDWKFLLGRDDSPFYPSLRLFRNRGEGIEDALQQVMAALERGDNSLYKIEQ